MTAVVPVAIVPVAVAVVPVAVAPVAGEIDGGSGAVSTLATLVSRAVAGDRVQPFRGVQ